MKSLDLEPDVIRIASELKVETSAPVAAVLGFCRERIDRWLEDYRGSSDGSPVPCKTELELPATTVDQVQAVVCERLRLVFEEIWTDADLDQLIAKYVGLREFAFAALRDDLDDETFATLLERRHIGAAACDRYVAVIDCRGPAKAARRYFTRWHEIAHLMTLTRQLQLPFHRSTSARNPTERLMDAIAGEIGFYDPIVRPALRKELAADGGWLTFAGVERMRAAVCPEASYRATLNACVARTGKPVVLIEAGLGYKTAERAAIDSRQLLLLPSASPTPQLRVLSAMSNDAARGAGLRVDRNMRVPASSLIARHFAAKDHEPAARDDRAEESLSIWRHSNGVALGTTRVMIETRSVADRILALLQPTAAARPAAPRKRTPE